MSKVIRAFNRAAETYDQYADIQQKIGQDLIDQYYHAAGKVLDLGSGTGYFAQKLGSTKQVILLDLAQNMLNQSQYTQKICAHFNNLPILDQTIDLCYANMALHWSGDLSTSLREIRRVLKQSGTLIFSMPLFGSLNEVYTSLEVKNPFYTQAKLLDLMNVSDFEIKLYTAYYQNPIDVLKAFKKMGVQFFQANNQIVTKKGIETFEQNYEKFRESSGLVPVTYKILLGQS